MRAREEVTGCRKKMGKVAGVSIEDGEVRISSSFNATKLWFNHKCPQFSAFVESLPSMCTPIRKIDSSSRLSIVKKDFGSSSSQIEITTLQHVYARQEAVDFWIAGKILLSHWKSGTMFPVSISVATRNWKPIMKRAAKRLTDHLLKVREDLTNNKPKPHWISKDVMAD
nr:replication protein A 70 kDa DNA-binding subunit B-like [Ipomoea batatas]